MARGPDRREKKCRVIETKNMHTLVPQRNSKINYGFRTIYFYV